MTRQDIHKYYKILDVTPDTPWEDVKRTYHDLMRVWHPDRFSGDPRLQKIVEEKTKELTYAFKKIEEDYHSIKFYHDPLDETEEAPIQTKEQTEPPVKDKNSKPSRQARKQEATEWLKKAKALETGNYSLIVDLLNKAIDLDPSLEEAYIERGEAHAMLGNHHQAVEDFTEVIESNSKSFRGFRGRASAYSELGNYSQAIIDLTSALELEPADYPELYYLRGKAHEELGNRDEAKEDFKNAKVLRILRTQAQEADSTSEWNDEWKIKEKRKISFKAVSLYVTAIICILVGILALTLPVILHKGNEKDKPKEGSAKSIMVTVSPSHVIEKAVPVPTPLPISDYEKAITVEKNKPAGDTPPRGRVKILTDPLEKEKVIQGKTLEAAAEKGSTSVQKKQHPFKERSGDKIPGDSLDRTKGIEVQAAEKKSITDIEKEREAEEKKAQQFEKLRELEKEFPFEMIK